MRIQGCCQAHPHDSSILCIGTCHYMYLMRFCRSTFWLCNLFCTYNYNLQAKHLGHSFHPSIQLVFCLVDWISYHGWLRLEHQCWSSYIASKLLLRNCLIGCVLEGNLCVVAEKNQKIFQVGTHYNVKYWHWFHFLPRIICILLLLFPCQTAHHRKIQFPWMSIQPQMLDHVAVYSSKIPCCNHEMS